MTNLFPRPFSSERQRLSLQLGGFRRPGLLAFLVATMAIMGGVGSLAQTASLERGGFVYTADEHGNSISVIDLAGGSVATVPIAISPHNVQITADGAWVMAVGELAAEGNGHGSGGDAHGDAEGTGRLLLFDATNLAGGPAVEIVVGAHPAHVIADQTGERAFITNSGDDTVSVVDLRTRTVIGAIGTGRYPHGLRMSPDGREIYVANVEDGTVSVLDPNGLAELARVPVGSTPVQVGFTPDGSRVYVSLRDDNKVAVVDTATRSLIGTIEVGRNPIQLHATPDGKFVYVANQGTEEEPDDRVSVIEVATGSVVDIVRAGRGAHGVAVSDDGALVFVTNIADSTVSVIDTATREVVATYAVGRGPNGVTLRSPALAQAASQSTDPHHPEESSSNPPQPGTPEDSPTESTQGGMPGMMSSETMPMMQQMMQQMMQGMMDQMSGGEGIFMCPMMQAATSTDASADTQVTVPGPSMLLGVPRKQEEMTPDRVRALLEQALAQLDNPRLKIGEIGTAADGSIIAEIVTIEDSLVQKLAFNRYPGLVRQIEE